MTDLLYATDQFTDLYFNYRIYDSWQVLNFTYFCFSLIAASQIEGQQTAMDRITAKSTRTKTNITPTFSGGYVKVVHLFCLYQRAARSYSFWIIPSFRKPSLSLFSSCG